MCGCNRIKFSIFFVYILFIDFAFLLLVYLSIISCHMVYIFYSFVVLQTFTEFHCNVEDGINMLNE